VEIWRFFKGISSEDAIRKTVIVLPFFRSSALLQNPRRLQEMIKKETSSLSPPEKEKRWKLEDSSMDNALGSQSDDTPQK
jgi:hypothetical protein